MTFEIKTKRPAGNEDEERPQHMKEKEMAATKGKMKQQAECKKAVTEAGYRDEATICKSKKGKRHNKSGNFHGRSRLSNISNIHNMA